MFANRTEAGQQLARALAKFCGQHPLILGLPRGGVVVAAEIARALAGDLDVLLVKKLRAPGNPELALGALAEDGHIYINEEVQRLTCADDDYLRRERNERLLELESQRRLYRKIKPRVPVADRTVILVDDGLATGATMMAAVQMMKLAAPRQLIVAVPVAPPEVIATFDPAVCLHTPAWFQGVGQFYDDFAQTTDTEVIELLRQA